MTANQFRKRLFNFFADADFIEFLQKNSDFEGNYSIFSDNKRLSKEEFKKIQDEILDPEKLFNGSSINILKKICSVLLKEKSKLVDHVFVGMLPTRQLNGCAVSYKQHYAILLDFGTLHIIQYAIRFYFRLEDAVNGYDARRNEMIYRYASATIAIAEWHASGKLQPPAEVALLTEISTTMDNVIHGSSTIEELMLLHEYGHIILNHLEADKNVGSEEGNHFQIKRTLNQEFEADEFAFITYYEGSRDRGNLLKTDIAFYLGILFRYADLVEKISLQSRGINKANPTHPPALDRWARIKQISGVNEDERCAARTIDYIFDNIVLDIFYETFSKQK